MSATTQEARRGSGPARAPRAAAPRRGFAPRGMVWLVWRQHRATFLVMLGGTVLATAALLYKGVYVHEAVAAVDGGDPTPGDDATVADAYSALQAYGAALAGLPFLVGAFVGAPLFAGDLESGTAKLVGVQSRSRTEWVATKLAVAALFSALAAGAMGAALHYYRAPLVEHDASQADFTLSNSFDSTGPVAVVLVLIGLLVGATVGLLFRRMLPSMVVTLVSLYVLNFAWELARMAFARLETVTTGGGRFGDDDRPRIPRDAVEIDLSYLRSDGSLTGWSTCVNAENGPACLREDGVVGWAVDYMPYSHFGAMQWTAAAALTGALLLIGVVTAYAARRTLR
ncbi:ABC transporter permease [Streptomyces sp. Z26]|uniref:ABC transporter permease n=1 Tax=Streptomyces TaxID=1883 RepID=UPI001F0C342E|nr:ABC transporter permease [Streptomyces sp. Z26]